ncbi:MAG: NAD(P)/FAD-dependent oxidoreductase [Endomicrobium sp.]|jgi:dihydrolipoamide dehydrogenase|nr:NAD(P)/FAD-dependent oxidoreductase [Endomicrobium sp.]
MNSVLYDVAVVGSGPGGFAAAVRAAQLGARVALVEKSLIGGTCLNCGCMPTKFLWQALKLKQKIQKSYEYGFKADTAPVVFADVAFRKDKNIANIRKGMELVLASYSVDVIKGQASFKTESILSVSNEKGCFDISADKIIIASGTEPSELKGFEFSGGKIINSSDALSLTEVPKSMLIIGGGAVGVEMATVFSGFGSSVTLAERNKQLLPNEDSEISGEIKKNLSRQGVEVLVSCKNALDCIDKYEKVLIVTGRSPININAFGIDRVGIKTFGKGFIETDKCCRTNVENIYAVGDIAGKNLLAYTAQNEGAVAAENAVKGTFLEAGTKVIPQAVFSMPQSASAEVTDFSSYKNVVIGRFPFTSSGRAFIECERTGFVKCVVDEISRRPLAFRMVGAHCDELVNTASQMLAGGGADSISRESFFHPSLSEALLGAYENALGKCTELQKKAD